MLVRHLEALRTVRRYLEPHPSWESQQLRAAALNAIRETIGVSTRELYDWYEQETKPS